jgi:hypothetical protein
MRDSLVVNHTLPCPALSQDVSLSARYLSLSMPPTVLLPLISLTGHCVNTVLQRGGLKAHSQSICYGRLRKQPVRLRKIGIPSAFVSREEKKRLFSFGAQKYCFRNSFTRSHLARHPSCRRKSRRRMIPKCSTAS